METRSLWLDQPAGGGQHGGRLEVDRVHDAVIVGGGIVGATLAWELARRGRDIAVLDAGPVAAGVTGQSTAKVTAGTGTWLLEVLDRHGRTAAAQAADATTMAISFVQARGQVLPEVHDDIDHDLYALTGPQGERLEALAREAAAHGLPAELLARTPSDLPVAASRVLRFAHQVLIDPVAYTRALLDEAARAGAAVTAGVTATRVHGHDPVHVETPDGTVRGDVVVLATHTPFPWRSLAFASTRMMRHYAVAGVVPSVVPTSYDVAQGWSTRPLQPTLDGRLRALAVGGTHPTGHGDPVRAAEQLALWARAALGMEVTHRWSSQDARSTDGLPQVGPVGLRGSVMVATGFDGWGLTLGTAAALDLARRLCGDAPLLTSWEPRRSSLLLRPRLAVSVARDTVARIAPTWSRRSGQGAPDRLGVRRAAAALPVGQGMVVGGGDGEVAVSRDEAGAVRAVHARCTHLGCVVSWNAAAGSWDCGCHGSRFGPDGRVLHGPALRPLPPWDGGELDDSAADDGAARVVGEAHEH